MKIWGKDLNNADFRALIGSFLLALLLWAAVTTDKTYSIRVSLPFEISELANGYVLSEAPPKAINLKLKGKGRALLGLYFYKPIIRLELPSVDRSTVVDLRDFKNQFYVGQELGITVEDVLEPKKIELKVDRYKETLKTITIKHDITPLPGYSLTGVFPEIDSIKVMGPAHLVDQIRTVESELVKIEKVRYPFTEKVKLISPYPEIVKIEPEVVNVKFRIEQIVERQLYNIPIQIIGVPENLNPQAIPPVISVRIKGSEQKVKAIQPEQITAIFDYQKDFRIGRSHYVPKIELPEGVTVVQISPRSFRLILKKKEDNQ